MKLGRFHSYFDFDGVRNAFKGRFGSIVNHDCWIPRVANHLRALFPKPKSVIRSPNGLIERQRQKEVEARRNCFHQQLYQHFPRMWLAYCTPVSIVSICP